MGFERTVECVEKRNRNYQSLWRIFVVIECECINNGAILTRIAFKIAKKDLHVALRISYCE